MRKKNDKNKNNMKEAKWTEQEDQKLIDSCEICSKITRVKRYCGKKKLIRRRNFGVDEEDLIIKLHALLGDRWSLIAGRLPGRTENEVNKYWNSHVRRKLKTAGIDPNNHRVDQTLIITSSSSTTYKNPNCIYHEDNNTKPFVSINKSPENLPESRHLNMNLTIASSSSSSSSRYSRFLKSEEDNVEFGADIEAHENQGKPTLVLFK